MNYLMENKQLYLLDLIITFSQYTEFETYYQTIVHKLTNLPETEISHLKTKLRSVCEKYNTIKIVYKEKEIINRLSKNPRIIVLRQDNGRGIVIIDKGKYTEKCMKILNTKQFFKLQKDPTKNIEMKIQKAVRKIKNKLSPKEYLNIYPTGSSPGKFYGTAKKHKLTPTGTIDDLPIGLIKHRNCVVSTRQVSSQITSPTK